MKEPDLIKEALSRGSSLSDILDPTEMSPYNPSKENNMPSITKPDKKMEPVWWFSESKKVPIAKLNLTGVVVAYLHSLKICRHHTRRLMSFQEKQEYLSKRANELGISLPDSFEETKELLDQVKKSHKSSPKSEPKPSNKDQRKQEKPVILESRTEELDKRDFL